MDILAELVCDEDAIPELCGSVLFLLCGVDSEKLNMTLLDTIVHHTPAGASSKTLIHYGQEMASSNIFYFTFCDTLIKIQGKLYHMKSIIFRRKQL